jgi:hypothetical protein
LNEIRDNELYKEVGFETWDSCLKHLAKDMDVDKRQLQKLMDCAQIRAVLPDFPHQ